MFAFLENMSYCDSEEVWTSFEFQRFRDIFGRGRLRGQESSNLTIVTICKCHVNIQTTGGYPVPRNCQRRRVLQLVPCPMPIHRAPDTCLRRVEPVRATRVAKKRRNVPRLLGDLQGPQHVPGAPPHLAPGLLAKHRHSRDLVCWTLGCIAHRHHHSLLKQASKDCHDCIPECKERAAPASVFRQQGYAAAKPQKYLLDGCGAARVLIAQTSADSTRHRCRQPREYKTGKAGHGRARQGRARQGMAAQGRAG